MNCGGWVVVDERDVVGAFSREEGQDGRNLFLANDARLQRLFDLLAADRRERAAMGSATSICRSFYRYGDGVVDERKEDWGKRTVDERFR